MISGRSLHWVIRNSDLRPSLEFFEHVLGMCVLRHEEHDRPCDITCNGRCRTAWSKTMMGWKGREEDFAYALEVTYNYGIESYETGSGLQKFGVFVPNPDTAVAAAMKLGFHVESNNTVMGPDKYLYHLLQRPQGRQEPFAYVALQVSNLERSVDFYTKTLGMTILSAQDVNFKVGTHQSVVGFASTERCEGVPLVLTQIEGVQIMDYDGRHAIEMPEKNIRAIYEDLEKNRPNLIVHKLRELHEALGTLVIAIVKDHDGYEICLVSSETFSVLVKSGTDYKIPDFKGREKRLANA